jgi:hypothetical protein
MSSTLSNTQVLGGAQSAKSTLEVINSPGASIIPETKVIDITVPTKTITINVEDNSTSLETIAQESGTITVPEENEASIMPIAEANATIEVSTGYEKNYKNLSYKPSINGVTLVGNLTSAEIGVIDDTKEGDQSTYSSKKIESLITKVLKGTENEPIILNSIEEGKYVISGYVKSTPTGEPMRVPLKTYIFTSEENNYVLWDANAYAASQYYIVFFLEDDIKPIEKKLEIVTKDYLHNATLDGGAFVKEEK